MHTRPHRVDRGRILRRPRPPADQPLVRGGGFLFLRRSLRYAIVDVGVSLFGGSQLPVESARRYLCSDFDFEWFALAVFFARVRRGCDAALL